MKKKNLMLLFISALLMGFTFASCGGSDDGEPKKPDTETPGGDDDGDDDDDDQGSIVDPSGSLDGSDYFIIQLDETSAKKIKSKVIAEFYANGAEGETEEEAKTTRHLYIWDLTYEAGTPQGPNAYGLVQGWPSFVVTSLGWSGAGFSVPAFYKDDLLKMKKIATEPENYYLHIAMKSKQPNRSHLISLIFGNNNTGAVALGDISYVDAGKTYQPYGQFTANGEWHEFNIPITEFMKPAAGGLDYSNESDIAINGTNVFTFLSGAVTGTTFDFDAVFIYKKKK